jgi:hypothetical protein
MYVLPLESVKPVPFAAGHGGLYVDCGSWEVEVLVDWMEDELESAEDELESTEDEVDRTDDDEDCADEDVACTDDELDVEMLSRCVLDEEIEASDEVDDEAACCVLEASVDDMLDVVTGELVRDPVDDPVQVEEDEELREDEDWLI